MTRECVSTDNAPAAIGPYSQANVVTCSKLVFCSGQIPIDPQTGELVAGDTAVQTEQVLKNLQAVLKASGTSLDKVVKTTVFLKNMDDFQVMNEVYARFFVSDPPARAAIQAAKLPKDVSVEIEAIAIID